MNNKFVLFCFVLILIVVIGWVAFEFSRQSMRLVRFPNGQQILVEVVSTDISREKGLSNRNSISSDRGMLFVFDTPGLYPFWMKNMRFPIDLVWIENDIVVGFEENMQPENPPITNYRPKTPVDKVLELKSGTILLFHLNIGDKLDITSFKQ